MTTAEWLRIGVGGVVPVHWDVAKADTGSGTLSGWASVYNVVDQQDDIVLPGAFRKALQEWRSSGRVVPLAVDHEHSSDAVIGSLVSATETPYGLKFTAAFSSTQRAQEMRVKAKEGHLAGLSIYGPIFKKSFESRDGRELRLLQELGLMEVTLTPYPANGKALVTSAKGGVDVTGQAPLDDAWVRDMRAALEIVSAPVRKAAVDLLIAAYRVTPPPGGDDAHEPGGDTSAAGDDGADAQVAAKYALALIGESEPDIGPLGGKPETSSLADLLAPLDAAATTTDLDALEAQIKQIQG